MLISHRYSSHRAARILSSPASDFRVVTCHLGSGCSLAAVRGGRSVDTTMGFTPTGGLVMGTRPGDLDPSLPAHLHRSAGISVEDYDRALNTDSGLVGLTGSNDFREVSNRAGAGDHDAALAVEIVAYRIRKYIGAYAAALGRVDAIAFTAGIGERSALLRHTATRGLELLGIQLDAAANLAATSGEHRISTPGSRVAVLVVPTNEELEIARQAAALVGSP